MDNLRPVILQLTDSVTTRAAAVRIGARDLELPLTSLLEKWLKHVPLDRLLQDGGTTSRSASTLFALQDLVYATNDNGRLMDMFPGVAFRQMGKLVRGSQVPQVQDSHSGETPVSVIDLTIDRTNVGYDRNWTGFHKRRWDRNAAMYASFVRDTLEEKCGPAEADSILQLDSQERKLRFLQVLAERVWESDFENYSRFVGDKLIFKSGDETVRNMMAGAGGICTEKVQALKFFTDHFGLASEYVISGDATPNPVPVAKLRELLTTFDFRFAKRYMRYWQHIALLYDVDGVQVLVDATNGNIPFLFLPGGEAQRFLGYENKPSIKVRMVESQEEFYYHRVPQDIPLNLLFALEGWIPDADMLQVFDNELGLYLSRDFFVTPIPYKSDRGYDRLKNEYLKVCQRANFDCWVSRRWELESPLGEAFLAAEPRVGQQILMGQEHLLRRYNAWDGPGHESGLAIIGLSGSGGRYSSQRESRYLRQSRQLSDASL